MSFDLAVFIGRFQPFHDGHCSIIRYALTKAKKVAVVCGSSFQPRSPRNPWTFNERKQMIQGCFSESDNKRIHIFPLMDRPYNKTAWVWELQKSVNSLFQETSKNSIRRICLIGGTEEDLAAYENDFPAWESEVFPPENRNECGTEIRDTLFQEKVSNLEEVKKHVPEPSFKAIKNFTSTSEFKEIKKEQDFLSSYKKGWESSPYEPTFVTVDAVVVQSGHILMVRRGAYPGKGLLALPGGFLHADKGMLETCVSELRKETKLKVPEPVLLGSIKNKKVFDHPYRSLRGRTITHAFYFELASNKTLPKVKGGDDAKNAFWLELGQLDPTLIFEDHFSIIQELLKIYIT